MGLWIVVPVVRKDSAIDPANVPVTTTLRIPKRFRQEFRAILLLIAKLTAIACVVIQIVVRGATRDVAVTLTANHVRT